MPQNMTYAQSYTRFRVGLFFPFGFYCGNKSAKSQYSGKPLVGGVFAMRGDNFTGQPFNLW